MQTPPVEDPRPVTRGGQPVDDVRADEARAAGDEDDRRHARQANAHGGGGAVGWPPVRVLILSADIGAGHDAPGAFAARRHPRAGPGRGGGRRRHHRGGGPGGARRSCAAGPSSCCAACRGCSSCSTRSWRAGRADARASHSGSRGPSGAAAWRARSAPRSPTSWSAPTRSPTSCSPSSACAGRLDVPLVSAVTDLAALHYWAHHGCDLHLVIHPESAAEIRSIAGPAARILHVRGLSDAAFEEPADAGTREPRSASLAADRMCHGVRRRLGRGRSARSPASRPRGRPRRARRRAVRAQRRPARDAAGHVRRGTHVCSCSASPTGCPRCSARPTSSCTRRPA